MSSLKNNLILAKAIFTNWRMITLKPSLNMFLLKYMGKFKIKNVGGSLVIHSHLPAVNSKAFTRFVDEHLLTKGSGPSHAQIGLTNACPQHCEFCYSKKRSGKLLNTDEIIQLIRDLKKLGVFWLGFTGGEPLMNKDIVDIVNSAGDDLALKLFTTGAGLTEDLAHELKAAGLLYVSVSLDHWDEAVHDKLRGSEGAFQTALKAVKIFKEAGMHISVSSVVSREMIQKNQVHNLIRFLISTGVHEAWLSEAKPADEAFWNIESVITREEKAVLMQIQEQYNKGNEITVNYLGHFEDGSYFGCNAGNKMVFIDSFGEVSPCVFIPMSFGNIRSHRINDIFTDMKACFPTESGCFINKNFEFLKKYSHGQIPLNRDNSLELMKEVDFGSLPVFSRLNSSKGKGVTMKMYKLFSLCSTVIFAVVGLLFLFLTDPVLAFFNNFSPIFGLPEAPLDATNFYLALASAFMYLVTLIAFLMYRNPEDKAYPILLTHGKIASSLLSLYLFLTHQHYLIYIANFIVDGCIAIAVLLLIKNMKKTEAR